MLNDHNPVRRILPEDETRGEGEEIRNIRNSRITGHRNSWIFREYPAAVYNLASSGWIDSEEKERAGEETTTTAAAEREREREKREQASKGVSVGRKREREGGGGEAES